MRARCGVVGLAIAAAWALNCGYGASFVDCAVRCTAMSECPDGFTCGGDGLCRTNGAATACNVTPMVDGGGSADSADAGCPDDKDCDGILDEADNCPMVANPDQHDEDGDLLGDVCDKCPWFHDPADPDSDGDGVGDRCDPHPLPGTGSDTRWLFEGFQHGIPSAWSATTGWAPANGEDDVVGTISDSGGAASLTFASSTDPHWTVSAGFTVTSLTEGASDSTFVGVAAGSTNCQIFDDVCLGCGGERGLEIVANGGVVMPTVYELAENQEYVVHLDQLGGTSFDCTASHPDDTAIATTGSTAAGAANPSSQASILVTSNSVSATVQFHWVMIVTSP